MAGHHAGVDEESPEVRRGDGLARMRAQRLQVLREHPVGAHQPLDGHRGGDVGRGEQHPEVGDGENEHAQHAVGAVDQCQALLGVQLDGLESDGRQNVGTRSSYACRVARLALAHQHDRAVRQRGEVAGAAEAAELVHDGRDAVRQQPREGLGGAEMDAGMTGGQCRQAEEHHGPHHLTLDLRPRTGGVRADEGTLELGPELLRDVPGRERPETGGDAVCRRRRGGEDIDRLAGPEDGFDGVLRELDGRVLAGHLHHIVEGDRANPHGHGRGHVVSVAADRCRAHRWSRCVLEHSSITRA